MDTQTNCVPGWTGSKQGAKTERERERDGKKYRKRVTLFWLLGEFAGNDVYQT